jgi:hypothetical protein
MDADPTEGVRVSRKIKPGTKILAYESDESCPSVEAGFGGNGALEKMVALAVSRDRVAYR